MLGANSGPIDDAKGSNITSEIDGGVDVGTAVVAEQA